MGWHAELNLGYRRDGDRTLARFSHTGPLRVLQSMYPEGDAICHNVLVHPPGGLVGGDELDIHVDVGEGAHALITTPGAARFYRSEGPLAVQRTALALGEQARLEWLPQEALCFSGCNAENRISLQLAPGAQLLGWDVVAFGLPHADKPFIAGRLLQHIELPGVWLERGRIAADDVLLLDGRLGMAGHRCMATLFFAAGTAWTRPQRERLLESARGLMEADELRETAGATSPNAQVVLVRVLAPVVEPAMALMRRIRDVWRVEAWQLPSGAPRIWAT